MDGASQKETLKKLLRDYGWAVLIAVTIALLIRMFLIEAYRIPSNSMKPTLEAGDTLLVSKIPFGIQQRLPRYGEVVIFSLPTDPNRDFIKRVVALPGDIVGIHKGKLKLNGSIRVNPKTLPNAICGTEELPNISYGVCWEPPLIEDFGPVTVPQESIFVLGDQRTQPMDSRKKNTWGIIPISSVKASALWIWLSIEPKGVQGNSSWFSRIRFERMFLKIQ